MPNNTNYESFQELMAVFSSSYVAPSYQAYKSGSVLNRSTDSNFEAIFTGFIEITKAVDTLELTETLIGIAPPRSKKVQKDEYLKFLIGSYLQSMYILEQRLKAYATKLSRLYKKPKLPGLVKTIVYDPLKEIIKTRGSHVHSHQYSDELLDILSTSAYLHTYESNLKERLGDDFEVAQQVWKLRIRKNNITTKAIINQYIKVLHDVIWNCGEISFPTKD